MLGFVCICLFLSVCLSACLCVSKYSVDNTYKMHTLCIYGVHLFLYSVEIFADIKFTIYF